ncbi:MAG: D-tyrosyl-tRNA(Tyr) deacylase [Planctomycetes bacterium]|nr:D-tyrosyl-tRNA(Tyr) deacylase [Planctomycetota bacterium]
MLCVVQRVSSASVVVDGVCTGEVGRGLLVLVGVHQTDTDADAAWMIQRLVNLRIFADEAGKMNLSVQQIAPAAENGVLLVPNFTLCAQTGKGNRPSFTEAMEPARAEAMFRAVCGGIASAGVRVATGIFGADMKVSLVNDGPVTILLDSVPARRSA